MALPDFKVSDDLYAAIHEAAAACDLGTRLWLGQIVRAGLAPLVSSKKTLKPSLSKKVKKESQKAQERLAGKKALRPSLSDEKIAELDETVQLLQCSRGFLIRRIVRKALDGAKPCPPDRDPIVAYVLAAEAAGKAIAKESARSRDTYKR